MAYKKLKEVPNLTKNQRIKFQQILFFIGVKKFNSDKFSDAISYFKEMESYSSLLKLKDRVLLNHFFH